MTKHNILTASLLILFISGCSSEDKEIEYSNDSTMVIHIDLDESREIKLSTIFSDIEYIPLETSEGNLVGTIRKMEFDEDHIFLFDHRAAAVTIFSSTGAFIRQIPIPEGNGPGELYMPIDFSVNASEETISVLGLQRMNIYTYDGKVEEETFFEINPFRLSYLRDGTYAFYMGNALHKSAEKENRGYKLIFANEEGEISHEALPISKKKADIPVSLFYNFSPYNGHHLFWSFPEYNIFQVTPGEVHLKYYLDFGDDAIPEELYENRKGPYSGMELVKKILSEGYVNMVANFMELDDMIYFQFSTYNNSGMVVFYQKESDEVLLGASLINDMDYGVSHFPMAKRGDELVTYVQPSDLIERANEIKQTLSREELEQYMQREQNLIDLTRDMSQSDNPVLIFCELKAF